MLFSTWEEISKFIAFYTIVHCNKIHCTFELAVVEKVHNIM